jgi:hypothetical protein
MVGHWSFVDSEYNEHAGCGLIFWMVNVFECNTPSESDDHVYKKDTGRYRGHIG